jgi:putative endonuclease
LAEFAAGELTTSSRFDLVLSTGYFCSESMAYWVYVLRSQKTNRRYVGHADNLEARINRHNSGLVFATAPHCPWKLVYSEELPTRSEAMVRERFYKTGRGRELLDRIEAELEPPALSNT